MKRDKNRQSGQKRNDRSVNRHAEVPRGRNREASASERSDVKGNARDLISRNQTLAARSDGQKEQTSNEELMAAPDSATAEDAATPQPATEADQESVQSKLCQSVRAKEGRSRSRQQSRNRRNRKPAQKAPQTTRQITRAAAARSKTAGSAQKKHNEKRATEEASARKAMVLPANPADTFPAAGTDGNLRSFESPRSQPGAAKNVLKKGKSENAADEGSARRRSTGDTSLSDSFSRPDQGFPSHGNEQNEKAEYKDGPKTHPEQPKRLHLSRSAGSAGNGASGSKAYSVARQRRLPARPRDLRGHPAALRKQAMPGSTGARSSTVPWVRSAAQRFSRRAMQSGSAQATDVFRASSGSGNGTEDEAAATADRLTGHALNTADRAARRCVRSLKAKKRSATAEVAAAESSRQTANTSAGIWSVQHEEHQDRSDAPHPSSEDSCRAANRIPRRQIVRTLRREVPSHSEFTSEPESIDMSSGLSAQLSQAAGPAADEGCISQTKLSRLASSEPNRPKSEPEIPDTWEDPEMTSGSNAANVNNPQTSGERWGLISASGQPHTADSGWNAGETPVKQIDVDAATGPKLSSCRNRKRSNKHRTEKAVERKYTPRRRDTTSRTMERTGSRENGARSSGRLHEENTAIRQRRRDSAVRTVQTWLTRDSGSPDHFFRRLTRQPISGKVFGGRQLNWFTWILLLAGCAAFLGMVCMLMGVLGEYFAEAAGLAGIVVPEDAAEMHEPLRQALLARVEQRRAYYLAACASIENIEVHVRWDHTETGDTDEEELQDNWLDALAVYGMQWNLEHRIDWAHYAEIEDVYIRMNPIHESVESISDENGIYQKSVIYIEITASRVEDLSVKQTWSLTEAQQDRMIRWIRPPHEQARELYALLGLDLTPFGPCDYSGIMSILPYGSEGAVLQEAQRYVGWTYSQPLRMTEGYADCSSFVWRVYQAFGIDFGGSSWAPTAADMASWSETQGLAVPFTGTANLLPGDVLFWGGKDNGRYGGIYHVGIYAGEGMVFEASTGEGFVVYRGLWGVDRISFLARPISSVGFTWDGTTSLLTASGQVLDPAGFAVRAVPTDFTQSGLVADYTPYLRNWSRGTNQRCVFEYWQQAGGRKDGPLAQIFGYYLVAVSPKMGSAGDIVLLRMENGQTLPCIVADEKGDDRQHEWGHRFGRGISLVEWEGCYPPRAPGDPVISRDQAEIMAVLNAFGWNAQKIVTYSNLGSFFR